MAVFIVDPDIGGSPPRDYASIYDAFVGEAGDQLGDSFEIEMRSTAGSADTTPVSVSGISNYSYIEIRPFTGQESNGIWDSTKPRLDVSSNWGSAISINLPGTSLSMMQLRNTGDYTAQPKVVEVTESCSIKRCYCWLDIAGPAGNSSPNINLDALAANSSVDLVYNLINYGYNGVFSVWPASGISINMINNTIVNCNSNGIRLNGVGNASLTNNLCNLNAIDYELLSIGSLTSSNNISADETSPDTAYRGMIASFSDQAANDFRLDVSDSAAIDNGIATQELYDIAQTSVPQGGGFDIGAFEYYQQLAVGVFYGIDAALASSGIAVLASDAGVSIAQSELMQTDMAIESAQIALSQADSAIEALLTAGEDSDAALSTVSQLQYASDAITQAISEVNIIGDSVLTSSESLAAQLSAAISGAIRISVALDSVLEAAQNVQYNTSAVVTGGSTSISQVESVISKVISVQSHVDYMLQSVLTLATGTDSLLTSAVVAEVGVDSSLIESLAIASGVDASVIKTASEQIASNAVVKGSLSADERVDAVVMGLFSALTTIDSCIERIGIATALVDSYLVNRFTTLAWSDAAIRATASSVAASDAVLSSLAENIISVTGRLTAKATIGSRLKVV